MDETRDPGIMIGQIYLDRAEFSHREDALGLPTTTRFEPDLIVQFQGAISPDEKGGFVRITVETKPADRPLYNVSVTMMALLQVEENRENLPLRDYVRTAAPAMMYPFLREAVASLTGRGRFGPIWLKPFNVAAAAAQGESAAKASLPLPKIKRPSKTPKKTPKARSAP